MKLCYLLAAGLILSFLLVAALPAPICRAEESSTIYVWLSWNDSGVWATPVKAKAINYSSQLGDTFQSKVMYDGSYFYIAALDNVSLKVLYFSGQGNGDWGDWTQLRSLPSLPYLETGSIDLTLRNGSSTLGEYCYASGSNGGTTYMAQISLSGGTMTSSNINGLAGKGSVQGGTIASLLDGNDYSIWHRDSTTNRIYLQKQGGTQDGATVSSVTHGNTTTGGNVLVPYNTTAPYQALAIVKDASNTFYWNLFDPSTYATTSWVNAWQQFAVGTSGFSDFSVTYEANAVHMVYLDASENLMYNKFSNQAWGTASQVVASGSAYPTISIDGSGTLYLTYVAGGIVKCKSKTGAGSWSSEQSISGQYLNAASLSSSKVSQSGRISLVWSANEIPTVPSPSNTQTWLGVSLPHVYAAITVWSIALIVGVGAAFMTGDVKDLPYVILIGLGILVVLFVSLTILSAFGSL